MSFSLPKLDFEFSGLEPIMDSQTVEIHYTKHHQAYVNNLNAALEKHGIETDNLVELLKGVNDLPSDIVGVVKNNGGGHFNHSLFWSILSTDSQKNIIPSELLTVIEQNFGSFDAFKAQFEDAGMKRFGSGWVWLVKDESGALKIVTLPNQDAPVNEGVALLGVDLWEHAYYLKYQNKRAEYLKNIWSIINWQKVFELYSA